MVDFKVFYKKNEYLPELLTVRVVSHDLKFFLESLDYLKNFCKLKVHICRNEDHPTLQFHIIGEEKLGGIVRDLNDIKLEVEEIHKENLKRHNAEVKAKSENDSVKDYHNQSMTCDCNPDLNRNDTFTAKQCGCENGSTDANHNNQEEAPIDEDPSVIRIEISGDENVKRKFIEQLLAAAKEIAGKLMAEE